MEFKFKVKGDRLIGCAVLGTNSGNVNTYDCSFSFEDGTEFTWICVFKKGQEAYQQVIENGKCVIPKEVLEAPGTFFVGCYGTYLDKRISTNWLEFSVAEGAYCEATMPDEPTPDIWETLVMNSLPYIGKNGNWYVYDKDEQGYKDSQMPARGEKGNKGDKGDPGKDGYTPQRGVDYWTKEDRETVRKELEDDLNFEERLASTVGNYGNTLKRTETGEVVILHDVSPIEHEMNVYIRDNNGVPLSRVMLKKYGGNILDTVNAPIYHTNAYVPAYLWERTETGVKMTAASDIASPSYRVGYCIGTIEELKGKTITVSGKFNGAGNAAISVICCSIEGSKAKSIEELLGNATYEEGRLTSSNIKTIKTTDSKYDMQMLTYTLPETTDYPYIVVCFYGAVSTAVTAGQISEWSNIQVQIGDKKTGYETYKQPEIYISDESGNVKGVTAFYPSTILSTDNTGATIHCEYNRDINKAYEELTNAIISLGGNV